jgi:hypothetical protein
MGVDEFHGLGQLGTCGWMAATGAFHHRPGALGRAAYVFHL